MDHTWHFHTYKFIHKKQAESAPDCRKILQVYMYENVTYGPSQKSVCNVLQVCKFIMEFFVMTKRAFGKPLSSPLKNFNEQIDVFHWLNKLFNFPKCFSNSSLTTYKVVIGTIFLHITNYTLGFFHWVNTNYCWEEKIWSIY